MLGASQEDGKTRSRGPVLGDLRPRGIYCRASGLRGASSEEGALGLPSGRRESDGRGKGGSGPGNRTQPPARNGLRPGIAGEFRPCRGRDRTSCRVAEVGRRRPGPEKRGVGVTTGPRDRGPGPQRETAAVEGASRVGRTLLERGENSLRKMRGRIDEGSEKGHPPMEGVPGRESRVSFTGGAGEATLAEPGRPAARKRGRPEPGEVTGASEVRPHRSRRGRKRPARTPGAARRSEIVVVNVDLSCLLRAQARGQVGSRARQRVPGREHWVAEVDRSHL